MGIRKEIKALIKKSDVRGPWDTINAIEGILDRPKPAPKSEPAPHLIITRRADGLISVEAKGVPMKDAPALLAKAHRMVELALSKTQVPVTTECGECRECQDGQ